MEKKSRLNILYFVAAAILIMLIQQMWISYRQVETVPYSRFMELLQDGRLRSVAVSDEHIRGVLAEPLPDGRTMIYTVRVEPDFAEHLSAHGVEFTGQIESGFLENLLSWVIPIAIFIAIWAFFIRGMAEKQGFGGLMSIGKSKAKVYVEKNIDVTFDDVAGVDEAKAELAEVVEFLRNPGRYGRLGARIAKGILLVGPPGTGKTLLARAVAGEASVPFFSINGSEFVEMFVGVGAARVRDLFEQARTNAPCIIFIDELDALGRACGAGQLGGEREHEQTLNQLLAELDGFDPRSGVVLLSATNRPETLDPALLRPGRFDRQVLVDRPDKTGRREILVVHATKIKMAEAVDLDRIAGLTAGFSGADLANLVNEAAVMATRRDADAVEMEDFVSAIERIVAGLEKRNRLINEDERRVVAFHEMGHAIVAMALPGTDPVQKVSIIPRGIGSLGYTIQRPTEDRYLMTREELENKMAVLLGGRAAELLVFGELSTGAADDIQRATDIARSIVTRYGMDAKLGQAAYAEERGAPIPGPLLPSPERPYSEETAREIDCAVRDLVNAALDRANAILEANRDQLERYAGLLLHQETLDEADLKDVSLALGGGESDHGSRGRPQPEGGATPHPKAGSAA